MPFVHFMLPWFSILIVLVRRFPYSSRLDWESKIRINPVPPLSKSPDAPKREFSNFSVVLFPSEVGSTYLMRIESGDVQTSFKIISFVSPNISEVPGTVLPGVIGPSRVMRSATVLPLPVIPCLLSQAFQRRNRSCMFGRRQYQLSPTGKQQSFPCLLQKIYGVFRLFIQF